MGHRPSIRGPKSVIDETETSQFDGSKRPSAHEHGLGDESSNEGHHYSIDNDDSISDNNGPATPGGTRRSPSLSTPISDHNNDDLNRRARSPSLGTPLRHRAGGLGESEDDFALDIDFGAADYQDGNMRSGSEDAQSLGGDIGEDGLAWDPHSMSFGTNKRHDTTSTSMVSRGAYRASISKIKGRDARSRDRLSSLGIAYKTLTPAFIKQTTRRLMKQHGATSSTVSADAVQALTDASDVFFQQSGADLGAYSQHAGRKTINEADVHLLMKR